MTESEALRTAREFVAATTVAMIEHQLGQLVEHVAYMTPEHAHRIVAAVERYSEARKRLIPPTVMQPGSDARN
jgi:hypothetical protein